MLVETRFTTLLRLEKIGAKTFLRGATLSVDNEELQFSQPFLPEKLRRSIERNEVKRDRLNLASGGQEFYARVNHCRLH